MFYATQALLLTKDLSFSKHAANIAAFGQHFASTGIVPVHLHRYLIDAFDFRQAGDYDITIKIPLKQAEKELDKAKEFLKELTMTIQKLGYTV